MAFYNPEASRVELYLESTEAQVTHAARESFVFRRDERIHVEYSYKYSIDGFRALAHASGLNSVQVWTDADNLFSVHFLDIP